MEGGPTSCHQQPDVKRRVNFPRMRVPPGAMEGGRGGKGRCTVCNIVTMM